MEALKEEAEELRGLRRGPKTHAEEEAKMAHTTLDDLLQDEQRTKDAIQSAQRRAEENLASGGGTGTFRFHADGNNLQMAEETTPGAYARNERGEVIAIESARSELKLSVPPSTASLTSTGIKPSYVKGGGFLSGLANLFAQPETPQHGSFSQQQTPLTTPATAATAGRIVTPSTQATSSTAVTSAATTVTPGYPPSSAGSYASTPLSIRRKWDQPDEDKEQKGATPTKKSRQDAVS